MNFEGMTFIGLMTIGFVNVVTFYKPNLDSKMKVYISVVFAFALTFVPVNIGVLVLDKMKLAIEIALMASGGYKIAQKAGGL